MPTLIDALPGLPMPVGDVTRTLASMWDGEGGAGAFNPSDFRASQLNLIIHYGPETPHDEALARFDAALEFAQRYPCRLLCLCPNPGTHPPSELEAKLFSQCYLGPNLRDFCCCEALILGYPAGAAEWVTNQLSVWLESDLPVHHWLHRIDAAAINRDYQPLLRQVDRVLYDSAVDGHAYASVEWPRPHQPHDLAWARTLPFRRSIGHLLGTIPPATLVQDLREVTLSAPPSWAAEARCLASWMGTALAKCGPDVAPALPVQVDTRPGDHPVLRTLWSYAAAASSFTWCLDPSTGAGYSEGTFSGTRIARGPLRLDALTPGQALAEAIFF